MNLQPVNTETQPFSGRSRTIRQSDNISTDTFLNRLLRIGSGSNTNQNIILEDEIDVERNLELYNNEQINALNPRVSYQTGTLNINTTLIRSSREESLRVVDSATTINLLSTETINKIKQAGKRFVHIGLVVIGIKGLGRKELGTKVLTLLLDKSWTNNLKKAIIAGMEVDLSKNSALFYCAPSILKDIKDLENLKIGLQTKGYENFIGNNLVISIGVLGKASNRSGMNFKININGIVENIASKGIRMIDPIRINPEDLAGLEWSLKEFSQENNQVLVPEKSVIYEGSDGTASLRFTQYKKRENKSEEEEEKPNIEYCLVNLEDLDEPLFDDEEPIYDTDDVETIYSDNERNEIEDEFDTLGYSLFEEDDEMEEETISEVDNE